MRRTLITRVALIAMVVVFAAVSLALSHEGRIGSEPAPGPVSKVVLFTIPSLGIDDVDPAIMPTLSRLARTGAIAATNVRSKGPTPNIVDAYATLGSGNRVSIAEEPIAPEGSSSTVPSDPTSAPGTSTSVIPGVDPGADQPTQAVVPLVTPSSDATAPSGQLRLEAMPRIIELADAGSDPGAQPGSLATALRSAGHRLAVVSNAGATIPDEDDSATLAPAALAAADPTGVIDGGSVGGELLRPADDHPSGVTADVDQVALAVSRALSQADVVVVDPGETTRASVAAEGDWLTPPDPVTTEQHRLDALTTTDAVLARVTRVINHRTVLIVVGVTPPGERWALTPMVVSGAGTPRGYLHSSSTQRPDLVTLTDVAPTVLDALGATAPTAMIGHPLAYRPGEANWSGALALDDLLASRAPIDEPMAVVFIAVQVAVYLAAVAALATRHRPPWMDRVLLLAVLTCAAWPLATFWMRMTPSLYSHGTWTFVLTWSLAGVVAAMVAPLRRHTLDPVLALCSLTAATLVIDLATGAHLQYGSFFGYAPNTAPRFIGIGNAAFAILGGATVVICTALVARSTDRSRALWMAGAVSAVVVLADGAPWMGTDVGGILTLVPVLSLLLWSLSGRRVRWSTIATAAAVGAAVLGVAVAVEALRDPDQRTHIGRFFLDSSDSGSVRDTFARKWRANTAVLRSSPIAWTVPLLAAASFFSVASGKLWRRVLPVGSPERTGVTATLALGFLGWLLNDSGVVVLALTSVFLGPYIWLMAQERIPTGGSSPSAEPVLGNVERDMTTPESDPVATPTGRVVGLVPAKDRADSIGATVTALRALGTLDRIVVIDDGSLDDTSGEARRAGAEVLRLPANVGKGGAVAAGVAAAPDAEIFLLIDADVGSYASEAAHLLKPVLEDRADLVIGVLPSPGSKGGFGNVRRFSRWGIERGCGLETRAPLSGQRAVRARYLRELTASGRFGLEVAMTIDAARSGARVLEIDVAMDHRHTGRSLSGFRHRGTQGRDIALALWPRLVPARARRGALGILVLAALAMSTFTATSVRPTATALPRPAPRVVLFGIPGLTIGDINPETMPNLNRMANEGAVGLISPRTGGGPNSTSAYATIGAGDRVAAGAVTSVALDPDDMIEGAPAGVVVSRRTGHDGTGTVVVPAIVSLLDTGRQIINSPPGALGEALRAAGVQAAVVANSQTVTSSGEPDLSAPAALAVVDRSGWIAAGSVRSDLLTPVASSPFGLEADPEMFAVAVGIAAESARVIVVDPGEMDRYGAYRPNLAEDLVDPARVAALARTDDVLGRIAADLDPDTRYLVVGVTPGPGSRLAPAVLFGPDVPVGKITSASTGRANLVTLTDLAPTILRSIGVTIPSSMIGRPIETSGTAWSRSDLESIDSLNANRDSVYGALQKTFVWVAAAFYVATALLVILGRASVARSRPVSIGALTLAAWPVSGFLLRVIPATYGWGGLSHALVWLVAATLAGASLALTRRTSAALTIVTASTVALLVCDLATGGRLQVSSYLGSTPSVGARFSGLGNLGFGVLAGAWLVAATHWLDRSHRPPDARWSVGALSVVTIAVVGAPWMGADVGGTLSLVPACGVLLLLASGRRLNWRSLVGLAALGVVTLGLAIGVEAARPPEARTHIGTFFLGGGEGSATTTITRKWETNMRLLTGSRWSWLILTLGGGAAALVATEGRWRWMSRQRPMVVAGLAAMAVAAAVGWLTNDSGPLVAAMVAVFAAPLVLTTSLEGPSAEPVLLGPLGPTPSSPVAES